MYDKEQVRGKLRYWRQFMQEHRLPSWQELEGLELYMEQVVPLVSGFVNLRPHEPELEPVLTPSAINNYVRLRIMPPPVKKRYGARHIAHLIVICCLKKSMSLSAIQHIFPPQQEEEATRQMYETFVGRYHAASLECVEQLERLSAPVLDPGNQDPQQVERLILSTAVAGNLYMLLTDKLLGLAGSGGVPPQVPRDWPAAPTPRA